MSFLASDGSFWKHFGIFDYRKRNERRKRKSVIFWNHKVWFSLSFFSCFLRFSWFFKKRPSILHGRCAKWHQKTLHPSRRKKTTFTKPSIFDTRDPFWLLKHSTLCGARPELMTPVPSHCVLQFIVCSYIFTPKVNQKFWKS